MERNQSSKELRLIHKKLRDDLSADVHSSKSSEITKNVLALLESDFKGANIFLCFYPFNSEVNLLPLYDLLLLKGCELYFPVSDIKTHELTFYRIMDFQNDFSLGTYNIMEPKRNLKIFDGDDGIAITPGLVFDKNMNRIGYGGGFYDRFFSKYPKIKRIAPIFSNQLIDSFMAESHDVPMDYIVTDNCILRGNRL